MTNLASDVAKAAALAVELSSERSDRLDYTERSLGTVETMLAEAAVYRGSLPEPQLDALIQRFGCYILEVAYRQFGGELRWYGERSEPVLIVGEPNFHLAICAWGKVRGRLGGDEADNIPFFFAGFADRVRAAAAGDRALYL